MPRNTSSSTKRKMEPVEDVTFVGKRSKTGAGTITANSRSTRASRSSEEAAFNQKKCIAWFKTYTGNSNSPDTIGSVPLLTVCKHQHTYLHFALKTGPEGVEAFCRDLGVEPENVVLLVLAWKMGAKQMGYFTLQEWLAGLTDLQ